MSIRKRLILSNIAMILMPILFFILSLCILVQLFFGGLPFFDHGDGREPIMEEYLYLKQTAARNPDKLREDEYLSNRMSEIPQENAAVLIREKGEITYQSSPSIALSVSELPAFDFEEMRRPIHRLGNQLYFLQKNDFYYSNGNEGTVFLLQDAGFVKRFGPIVFGCLLLALIVTNGLLTYFVSKTILTPVNELRAASEKISEGDLDFHIESRRKDELGQLSRTFEIMRKKLKESMELQMQYEENRKELISNISHDLKTPLSAIKGYVEGIRDGVANSPEKLDSYTQTIYSKANELDHLIEELFLYSKLDMNRLPYHFEEIDIKEYIKDYVEELSLQLSEQTKVSFYYDQATSYVGIIDRDKLKRVFSNIIDNSLKYMDKEKRQLHIHLKTLEEHIKVDITDNGPGIKPEDVPYLFDRFYRVEHSRNTKTGGSGLGLAIAEQIIKGHGGDIWAESEINKGTTISFIIKKASNQGENGNEKDFDY
ncbi:sensor histidine kinase [Salibacterium aidingense]|uniref:sensor histidine kinase n=1 Tax=Salibacterium aidingense TaxID=384933 RepID=UPI00146FBB9F|nr:HAMP domain-containing sensor histidine kinase [Salibacterium aidingense]